jgi:two-component system OmpR family response regulator
MTRSAQPPRVLVVDDDRAILDMVDRTIRHQGFTMDKAETANAAIEIVGREPVRVAIVDVCLPHVDGLSLARTLRSIRPGIAILFMSGRPLDDIEDRRAGLSDEVFLQKPFSRGELLNQLVLSLITSQTPAFPSDTTGRAA